MIVKELLQINTAEKKNYSGEERGLKQNLLCITIFIQTS